MLYKRKKRKGDAKRKEIEILNKTTTFWSRNGKSYNEQ